jgi:hypothetical protein
MGRYSVKRKLNIDKSESCCIQCQRICKGERSLKSHITQSHNGDKDTSHRGKPKGTPSWNKGLTKDTDVRVAKGAATIKERIESGIIDIRSGWNHSKESKSIMSKKASENNRGGRSKWYKVNGISVQGTWERDIAYKLNDLGVIWNRPKPLKYMRYDGKDSHYTPDFYLPEFDMYLEVKGFWWGRDKEKMQNIYDQYPNLRIVVIECDLYEQILGL